MSITMMPPAQTGPKNLITDVPGLLIGNAQDWSINTGVSVLTANQPFRAAISIQGGAPGTRDTALLEPERLVEFVDAIVLSGGSAFGLEAASAIMQHLRGQQRGFRVGSTQIPIVPAAILFDLHSGGEKKWDHNPYLTLGAHAINQAATQFELGSYGAGTGATTATLKGGLGSASTVLENGHTLGALAAVNPYGCVAVKDSGSFWAAPFERNGEFGGKALVLPGCDLSFPVKPSSTPTQNTTLGIIATDYTLDKTMLKRLAIAAQDGLARAIMPAHTPFDGDLIFAVSTGRGTPPDTQTQARLGHEAALCLARAIARGVYEASPKPADINPTWQELYSD